MKYPPAPPQKKKKNSTSTVSMDILLNITSNILELTFYYLKKDKVNRRGFVKGLRRIRERNIV